MCILLFVDLVFNSVKKKETWFSISLSNYFTINYKTGNGYTISYETRNVHPINYKIGNVQLIIKCTYKVY